MEIKVDYKYKLRICEDYSMTYGNKSIVANIDYKLDDSFISHRLTITLLGYATDEGVCSFLEGESDKYIDKEVRSMLYSEVVGKHKENTLREKNSKKIKEFNKHVSKYRRTTFEYNDKK